MKPRFRFRLGGDTDISDPIGWNEIVLNLERDSNYHSLVEHIETPFEFWGRTASKDGGYARIKQARDNGPDSQVPFVAQVSWNGGTNYDTFFNGLLDLTTLKEVGIRGRRVFQCTILRDDLWAKFINRKGVAVDVQSPTGLDGTSISVVTPKTQSLPCQILRQRYEGTRVGSESFALVVAVNPYAILDFNTIDLSEIQTKHVYPTVVSPTRPFELFSVEYAGEYEITAEIHLSTGAGPTAGVDAGVNVYIQINDDTPISFARADVGSPNVRTQFTYTDTHTLEKNDLIRMYIFTTFTQTVTWETGFDNFLNVNADTEFPDSSCESLAIHDVASSIVDRIVGVNGSFYSELFGGTNETSRVYASDGDELDHSLMLGAHIRGYNISQKPMALSFDDWWEGANNIFNLGLGYDLNGSTEVIRVERKEHFYDDSSQSIILTGVQGIEISYDPDFIQTSITNGYQNWKNQSVSGIDDPQTVQTRSTRFKTVGTRDSQDLSLLSTFYAASLGIEQARRDAVKRGEDGNLDDQVVIIQSDLAASTATPIVYTSPTYVITDLLNPDTRYNVRLTPSTNFYRWKSFLNIGLYSYGSDFFKFQKGEGNTDMLFTHPGGATHLPNSVAESQDWQVESDFLFQAVIYSFTHPLTWNQYKGIRDNRKKSILLRYVDNDGVNQEAVAFIKKLAYKPSKSKADFQVWIKSVTPV